MSAIGAITIRDAAIGDIDTLYRVESAAARFPWAYDTFVNEFSNTGGDRLAAEADGFGVCGFVFAVTVVDELSIHNLAVHPGAQRHGIARRLVETALERGRLKGAALAYLEVRSKNDAAIALYHTLGFSRISIRRRYYPQDNDDALILRRRL